MLLRCRQTTIDRPPVVSLSNYPGHYLTTFQILGREACPASVVFQLIENILTVATVTVKLRNG